MNCDPRAMARCPHKRVCGDNPYFLDGSDCDKFNQSVLKSEPTNADRIRAMSDEELAEFIFSMQKSIWNALCEELGWVNSKVTDVSEDGATFINWLRSEAKEATE